MVKVYVTEREIQNAVEAVLNTHEWPIYKTDDDRGLEDDEYFGFARAVIRKIGMVVPESST